MTKLYIIRHGKTDWNKQKIIQGSTDIELNQEGIDQAKLLVDKIAINEIDICISSPLKRAKKTAEIIVNNKIPIIYDNLLLERGYGLFEGKTIDTNLIKNMWDYQLNTSTNNIESIKDCLKRSKEFLDKIKKEYPNKTILIVSHGGLIKTLHFNIIGYTKDTDFLSFNPQNATIYEYNI